MYLKEITINNYRLLRNTSIILDKSLTLFVGKNNSGKTSVNQILQSVIEGKKYLEFNDYPFDCREKLYDIIWKCWQGTDSIDDLLKNIPITSIDFKVDYSEECEDDNLGALAPFIIDLDTEQTVANILVKYHSQINDDFLQELHEKYNKFIISNGSVSSDNILRGDKLPFDENNEQNEADESEELLYDKSAMVKVVKGSFKKMFAPIVLAVNPSDSNDVQVRDIANLKDLFIIKNIRAERNLDETENGCKSPMQPIMSRLFDPDIQQMEEGIREDVEQLTRYAENISSVAENTVNNLLSEISSSMLEFGYPSAEDLQLKASTQVSLKSEIINNADLIYTSINEDETLPSTHNGLGYKNLIKITLLLQEFLRVLNEQNAVAIPILLIEEPEAHMHPQLQAVFINHIEKHLRRISGNTIQVLISTHSPHIANTIPFQQVRYMRRHIDYVECKNLVSFYEAVISEETKKENLEFLKKYMKISYCDLYFCDKAILVEGASERLLLPDMINKCNSNGIFGDVSPTLASQYYSIIEVGGAYAFKFFEFIDFLEIPTLVLTDIDFVDNNNKECKKEKASRTSNATINRWCHDVFNIAISNTIDVSKILELLKKTELHTNGLRHIEFQDEEYGIHPRSLEEAIMNVNRSKFGISKEDVEVNFGNEKKTDFALKLLMEPQYADYTIPSYIVNGLIWLNQQAKMPKKKMPTRKYKRKYHKK